MTSSDRKIRKLAEQADSFLSVGLGDKVTTEKSDACLAQALACMDQVLKEAAPDDRYPWALKRAQTLLQMVSREDKEERWRWLSSETSDAVLSGQDVARLVEEASRLRESDDRGAAVCHLDTAIAYSEPQASCFADRAECRFLLGDAAGAVDDATLAISLEPDKPGHYMMRALYRDHSRHGKAWTEEAIADYRAALQKDPTLAGAWVGLIQSIWIRLLFLAKSLEPLEPLDLDELISLCGQSQPFLSDPRHKAIRGWILCVALALAGDPVTEDDLHPLVQVDAIDFNLLQENIIDVVLCHVDGLGTARRFRERNVDQTNVSRAREVNAILLDRVPNLEMRLHRFERHGYWDKALHMLIQRLDENPRDSKTWFRKARALRSLRRVDEALQAFSSGDDWLDPLGEHDRADWLSREDDYQLWVQLLYDRGSYAEVLIVLRRFQILYDMPEKWAPLSECLFNLGRYEEALDAHPWPQPPCDNKEEWLLLGKILEELGRHEEALRSYSDIAQPDPGKPFPYSMHMHPPWAGLALFRRAQLLMKLGRLEDALATADELFDWGWEYESWDMKRRVFEEMGLLDEALEASRRACAGSPSSCGAHLARGMLLAWWLRKTDALEAFDDALANARPEEVDLLAKAYRAKAELLDGMGDFEGSLAALSRATELASAPGEDA